MPSVHIPAVSEDPAGLAGGAIVLVDVTGGARNDYHESKNFDGKWIAAAVKALKPVEEYQVEVELHDTASLVVPFGALINTNYIITGLQASFDAEGRPTATYTVVKPSAPGKFKAYGGSAVSVTLGGGFGVVELFGATASGADYISSSVSISMETLEASHPTDGDYLDEGIYHYGFKGEYTLEAYSAITIPAGAHGNPSSDSKQSRDGWKTFSESWWTYLDPGTL